VLSLCVYAILRFIWAKTTTTPSLQFSPIEKKYEWKQNKTILLHAEKPFEVVNLPHLRCLIPHTWVVSVSPLISCFTSCSRHKTRFVRFLHLSSYRSRGVKVLFVSFVFSCGPLPIFFFSSRYRDVTIHLRACQRCAMIDFASNRQKILLYWFRWCQLALSSFLRLRIYPPRVW